MEDHILGRNKSSLSGRCHERYDNQVTARGASKGQGLDLRVLEIDLQKTKDCAKIGRRSGRT